jgi:hypothetical protein
LKTKGSYGGKVYCAGSCAYRDTCLLPAATIPVTKRQLPALGNMNILNSTFGDYLLINKAQNQFFKTIDENRSKLSLKQIGGVSDFLSGIGS